MVHARSAHKHTAVLICVHVQLWVMILHFYQFFSGFWGIFRFLGLYSGFADFSSFNDFANYYTVVDQHGHLSTCTHRTRVARSRVIRSSPSLTTGVAAELVGIDYTSSLNRSRKRRMHSEHNRPLVYR